MSLVRVAAVKVARQQAVRAFAASPWGGDAWRHDKTVFKSWVSKAAQSNGQSRRELTGFLSIAFGDVDANKDGYITSSEFDVLLEKVAALPRRYGLAPRWEVEFGNDVNKRTASRLAIFEAIDNKSGMSARQKIGLAQFLDWCNGHIFMKAQTMKGEVGRVDLGHLGQYTKDEFVSYMRQATGDHGSTANGTMYTFLLTQFVECDISSTGTIGRGEFDDLIAKVAETPRFFGLAPMESSAAGRQAIFDEMDDSKSGRITFRKFLKWTHKHVAKKVSEV